MTWLSNIFCCCAKKNPDESNFNNLNQVPGNQSPINHRVSTISDTDVADFPGMPKYLRSMSFQSVNSTIKSRTSFYSVSSGRNIVDLDGDFYSICSSNNSFESIEK